MRRAAAAHARVVAAILALAIALPPAIAAADEPAEGAKAEAHAHFDKAKKLSTDGVWPAALAEFLASRELYATWGNTLGAASALRKLARFDEALDMFEVLLRDFAAALPADVRAAAQREVVELRELVGTIEIEQAELGAAITVDGRSRGEYPAPSPLRVGAGTHVIRVSKEGFEPFEGRVDVAGKQTARVAAKLRALVASGRLRVAEQSGAALEVIVDGDRVGRTPWEGLLAIGEHVALLRGDGELGTVPVPVVVKRDQTARLTLAAERLTARVRVEPVPANAGVAIDAVAVGQGVWEGRLRKGPHKIEVAAPGFLATAREVTLDAGARAVVQIPLARDPGSPFWRKAPPPSRFLIEVAGAAAVIPSVGGDIAGACTGSCSAAPGLGGYVAIRGGYELSSGFAFGLAAGYLFAEQAVSGRDAALTPVGLMGNAHGKLDDTLAIRRGILVGPWLGFSLGERFPVHGRVAFGPMFAWVGDTRSGTFKPVRTGPEYPVGPLSVSAFTPFVQVTPDLRFGYRVTPHFEVNLGVDALILVALGEPGWDAKRQINAGSDGIGTFPAERFIGRVLVGVAPGLGARYEFF
ncbi:MAG: PEGA domain-containing protein [Byssovorax sp.]